MPSLADCPSASEDGVASVLLEAARHYLMAFECCHDKRITSHVLMSRLCACLILVVSCCRASVDAAAILQRAQQSVAVQLARAANYACVETVDRQYFISRQSQSLGCAHESASSPETLGMRDRLRLDIAVSEGREIYSWHGEAKFTSSDVSEVVRTGPISSGNFVGFLHNIFLQRGTQFTYAGESEEHTSKLYNFNYVVPLGYSSYHIGTNTKSNPVVPYHGSFSIEGSDYHLARLQIVLDAAPADSPICSGVTTITYQLVNISGRPSLIPASFVLDLEDDRQHAHGQQQRVFAMPRVSRRIDRPF